MPIANMRQLLEAGIHFGHQTRRWNPKMSRFIFGERNGLYIIDLQKTLKQLRHAYNTVRETVANGGSVLFVGTKKQAQEPIMREAQRAGMYYINNRWLGGTLTNFETIRRSVRNLIALEEMETNGAMEKMTKKEAARLRKERFRIEKNLAGIKTMERLPEVMFLVDTRKEHIAVREAMRLGITSIGIVDTNCDPDQVSIPVPGNDDAIRAVTLFCTTIADACIEGKGMMEKRQAEVLRREEEARKQKLARARAAKAAEQEAPGQSAPAQPQAEAAQPQEPAEGEAPGGGAEAEQETVDAARSPE